MTENNVRPAMAIAKEALLSDREGLKEVLHAPFQKVLEAEMTEALGTAKGGRTERRTVQATMSGI